MARFHQNLRRTARRLTLMALALLGLGACSGHAPKKRAGETPRAGVAPDAERFAQDRQTRGDILEMSLASAHARLGSFHYEGLTQIQVTAGSQKELARESSVIDIDAEGHRSIKIETPRRRIEQIFLGDAIYVRYGTGHMRQKTPREMDPQELGDGAFDALRQAFVTLGPIAWEGPTDARLGATAVKRYVAREVAEHDDAEVQITSERLSDRLPKTPLGAWHKAAKISRLNARVDIDAAAGVVLDAKIAATFITQLERSEATEVVLTHERHLTQVGQVQPRRAPTRTVGEFRRILHDRNVLSFFRDALPKPAAGSGDPSSIETKEEGASATETSAEGQNGPDVNDESPPDESLVE